MMRRTLESVAAERLDKLGQNPNIISDREDLKKDQEALKHIVAKSTPNPSSSSLEQEPISEASENEVELNEENELNEKHSKERKSSKKSKIIKESLTHIKILNPKCHKPNCD